MKLKKMIILLAILIIIIVAIFFIKNNYKFSKTGNNISNKSADEIENYILNINSFEAEADITIISNKTENKYKVKQQYIKQDNIFKQELLEPNNICGLIIYYNGKDLQIKNTTLNMSKIYENYNYIDNSNLFIGSFIDDYIESNEKSIKEENNIIVLETKVKDSNNKYVQYKKLYINKELGSIVKLEVQDITQNTLVYILYNEVKINKLQKSDVLAFKTKLTQDEI